MVNRAVFDQAAPKVKHHKILLSGLQYKKNYNATVGPRILSLRTPSFIDQFLEKIKNSYSLDELDQFEAREIQMDIAGRLNDKSSRSLTLYQPIHNIYNMVVMEAYCHQPGLPRLDRKDILSAGFTVRKKLDNAHYAVWVKNNEETLGWQNAPTLSSYSYDTKPANRLTRMLGANRSVLLKSERFSNLALDEEQEFPLFIAPETVCEKWGKTILYGFLPVSSNERVSTSTLEKAQLPLTQADIQERIPSVFKNNASLSVRRSIPTGLSVDEIKTQEGKAFQSVLTYISLECGAFTDIPEALALRKVLAKIKVASTVYKNLNRFMYIAYLVFMGGNTQRASVTMGQDAWPVISDAIYRELLSAITHILRARYKRVATGEQRFSQDDEYVVTSFIRIKDSEQCAERTIWSPASEGFKIASWYESSTEPPTLINMPPVSMAAFKKIRPNVAFKIDPSLQKFMDKINIDVLLDKKGVDTSASKWGMICGFSIPIITICAFLLLMIVLQLLNFIFRWLPFVRICIPFPK